MQPNKKFAKLASDAVIAKTITALKKNNIDAMVVQNGQEAKEELFKILPAGAEIMNMSSATLSQIGADKEITDNPKYKSVRNQLVAMEGDNQKMEKQRLGAAHEWVVGSVHAITQDGSILVASASGSQLPSYAFGAFNVVWVAGSQKIVKDIEEGMKRIYEYCLPLENERALKVYGTESSVNKILIINKESIPGRIKLIIVKENLGF